MNDRKNVRTKAAIIVAVIVLLTVVIGAMWVGFFNGGNGEGNSRGSTTAKTPNSSSESDTAHVLDEKSVAKLNKTVKDAAEIDSIHYRMRAGARPSYRTDNHGKRQTMSILDVDNSTWDAGDYQLTVYCMGTGTLDVSFSIGETHEERSMTCSKDIAQESLNVRTEGADKGQVGITPSEDSKCEIAYLTYQSVS